MAKFKVGDKTIILKDKITVGEFEDFQKLLTPEERESAKNGEVSTSTLIKSTYFFVENQDDISLEFMKQIDFHTFQEMGAHTQTLVSPKKKDK